MNLQTLKTIPKTVIVLAAEPYITPGVFANFHDGMYLGGQVRFEAAAQLAKSGYVEEMILVGGYNTDSFSDPYVSDKVRDMADYIGRDLMGVRLTRIPSLPCTHHNFVAVFNRWAQSDARPRSVGVLSNAFHLARSLEFAKLAESEVLGTSDMQFIPIAAEELLGLSIKDIIRGHEEEYQKRVANEIKGLAQIQDGTYQDVCLGKWHSQTKQILQMHAKELLTGNELSYGKFPVSTPDFVRIG